MCNYVYLRTDVDARVCIYVQMLDTLYLSASRRVLKRARTQDQLLATILDSWIDRSPNRQTGAQWLQQ